ncbi:hypothetical protein V5O36_25340, partial [Serratia liquefaciens]
TILEFAELLVRRGVGTVEIVAVRDEIAGNGCRGNAGDETTLPPEGECDAAVGGFEINGSRGTAYKGIDALDVTGQNINRARSV